MNKLIFESVKKGFYAFRTFNPALFESSFSNKEELDEAISAWSLHPSIIVMDVKTLSKKMARCACNRNVKCFPRIDQVIAACDDKT